ncbi:ABC-type transport system involved in multi-copper enzyme maturation permease subunit [Kitasatospora gansuensis]|uniref:ABC-type transport system involved in multi-copper enzyme maturation permease subunit n=1 Tax=Kitasatospora gansuensis TaxID=258050 RepID=A0A7W7S705_9ACTN|nr:hypothetical protein [Kitasatospora gansuensis]MBB4945081.1 ABC-type transport system involved in multi-copper enzyme maturation permease subunit [Kitasatospora gansuensis]
MSTSVLTKTEPEAGPGAGPKRTAPRPTGLLWLAWRQSRPAVLVLAVGLLLATAALLVTHFAVSSTVETMRATKCYSPGAWDRESCYALVQKVEWSATLYLDVLQPALTFLPLLIGMLLGAPLVAQELERGTHRLVWVQSVTPTRWLAARIGVPMVAVTLTTGALALLSSWVWWTDIVHSPALFDPPFQGFTYPVLGPALLTWSLFSFALGLAVGLWRRRTVSAILLTGLLGLVGMGVMRLLRPALYPVLSGFQPFDRVHGGFAQPTNAWLVESGPVLADGTRQATFCTRDCDSLTGWWGEYHPASHLVPIQLIESGILLLLTAALVTWTVRRIGRPDS